MELGAVNGGGHGGWELYQRAAERTRRRPNKAGQHPPVSPTWAEIEAVTEKVREALKAEGVVSHPSRYAVGCPLHPIGV